LSLVGILFSNIPIFRAEKPDCMPSFPLYRQLDAKDCGPACLQMIAKYYGKNYTIQSLREKAFITRQGVSLLGISDAAESIGFKTVGVRLTWAQLLKEAVLPCIAHWNQNHFVVVYKVTQKGFMLLTLP